MNAAVRRALMVGFGGPTRPDEIRPFLENVVRGRPIPPARLEEVAHHYEAIGGRSPYNELTLRQADALRALLEREGPAIPVYAGMRNWAPYVKDVMREMRSPAERGEFSASRWRPIAARQAGIATAIRLRKRSPDWATMPRRSIIRNPGTTIRSLSARWRRASREAMAEPGPRRIAPARK